MRALAVVVGSVAAISGWAAAPVNAGQPRETFSSLRGSFTPAGPTASVALSAATPRSGWSISATPNPLARTGQLLGVSCSTPSSCTAVGDFTNGSGLIETLAEHWDGAKWVTRPTPNPPSATLSKLISVFCSSPSACIGVGQAISSSGMSVPLSERWDGARWRIQAAGNPPARGGVLNSVACTSASACIAVGRSNAGTMAEQWNGNAWQIEHTPNPSGAQASGTLVSVSCTSASSCTAVGGSTAGTLTERWDGHGWQIQPSPNPSQGGANLASVSCTSASSCTAVGGSNAGTLAERWNGAAWRIVPSPNPSGTRASFLNAVSCTSAMACTAAGSDSTSPPETAPLAERWDGTRWQLQHAPDPRIPPFAFHLTGLNAVSCTSNSACTAVGSSMSSLSTPVALAERWDGSTWAIQVAPNDAGAGASGLFSVACASDWSCMAVGGTSSPNDIGRFLAEEWNGNRWSIVPTPQAGEPGELLGVACVTPTSCQAVGNASNRAGIPVVRTEHWNGRKWGIEPTPQPGGAQATGVLGAVSCSSSRACTAVGFYARSQQGSFLTLAEHWNGARWSIELTPNPAGGGSFNGVACPTSALCFAAGGSNSNTALIERWNGRRWRIVPSPSPPAGGVPLGAISCLSASFCMATGRSNSGTLAERWNGRRWQVVPTPNPASGGGALGSVSCTSPSACTAVGFAVDRAGNEAGTLGERWDGTRWSLQGTPTPAQSFEATLDGVACPQRLQCIAVGDYGNETADRLTLGLQWHG